MYPYALLTLLLVRSVGAALSNHRAAGDPAVLPLDLDAEEATDLDQATEDLVAAEGDTTVVATDAIKEVASSQAADELALAEPLEPAMATAALSEPAADAGAASRAVMAESAAAEAEVVPAPKEVDSKRIKAQLWEVLETLRDSRGSTGWQAPLTSYEIEPPTQEMQEASAYGRAAKIFLTNAAIKAAAGLGGAKCGFGAAPFTKGRRINVSAGPLRRSRIWFLDTLNYTLREYLLDRAHCGHLHIVLSPEEADLCFPSCDANDSSSGLKHDVPVNSTAEAALSFAVPAHRRTLFEGCEQIDFILHPQSADRTPCTVAVPAVHGVARPPGVQEQDAPWNVVHQRESLLSYIGGTPKHATIIDDMTAFSRELDDQRPQHIFYAPVLHTAMDSRSFRELKVYQTLAWELYSSSEFAWQGATPSRRGFYDCWMVGTIPVIPMSAAYSYSAIMDGQPFKKMLRNLAVIIPENISHSGRDIIKHLQQISPKSILMRRRRIRQVAPFLQYGWSEKADAFTASIGALIQRSAENSAGAKSWWKAALGKEKVSIPEIQPTKTPEAALPKSPVTVPADQASGNQTASRNGTAAAVKTKPAPSKTQAASRTSTTFAPAGKIHHKERATSVPTEVLPNKKEGAHVKSTATAPAGDRPKRMQNHQARQGSSAAAPAEGPSGENASASHTQGSRAIASVSKPFATDAQGADPRAKASATTTPANLQALKDPRNTTKQDASHAVSHSNGISASANSVDGTTTPKVLDAAWPGDAIKVEAIARPSTASKVSSVTVDLVPDDVTSTAEHGRFMQVMAVCALFITLAGISLLTSPGLTESMRNPCCASV